MEHNNQAAPAAQPAPAAAPAPAVAKAKKPVDGAKIAKLNAFSLSFAAFFGVMTIFAAIAEFTNYKWSFSIPGLSGLLFANAYTGSTTFIMATLALIFGIIGLITVNKITDADALNKSWKNVANVFMIFGIIYGVNLIATAIYALLGVGKKAGLSQKEIWLNCFLPMAIICGANFGIYAIAKQIVNGKTTLVRVMSFISLGVASIGFIMVLISTLIGFYGKKSSSSLLDDDYDYDDYYDLYDDYDLDDLYDLFNY